jgi:branched-chain amino acid transport system permease protein
VSWSSYLSIVGATSAEYFLLGLGFSCLYSVTKAFNLVLSASFFLGAAAAFVVGSWDTVPIIASLMIGAAVSATTGATAIVVCEQFVLRRLRLHRADGILILLATFAIYMIVENAGLILTRSRILYFDWLPVTRAEHIFGLTFTRVQLATLLIAALTMLLWTIGRGRMLGLRARATENDDILAIIAGVDANRLILILSAIAGGCMGVAGFLHGATTGLQASMGFPALFPAIVVGIIAGKPETFRLLVAASALAVAETTVVVTVSQQWQSSIAYIGLAAALLVYQFLPSLDRRGK